MPAAAAPRMAGPSGGGWRAGRAQPKAAEAAPKHPPAELGLRVLAELLGRLLVAPGRLRRRLPPPPRRRRAGEARAARRGDAPGLRAAHDAALAVQAAAGGAEGPQLPAHGEPTAKPAATRPCSARALPATPGALAVPAGIVCKPDTHWPRSFILLLGCAVLGRSRVAISAAFAPRQPREPARILQSSGQPLQAPQTWRRVGGGPGGPARALVRRSGMPA